MRHSPQIVFGLGSGRCGTQSLAAWLDCQEGARVSHEMHGPAIAWEGAHKAIDETIRGFLSNAEMRLVGDVALYYLPYVGHILAAHSDVRFICLKRDREETVVSFLRKTPRKNHWIAHGGVYWKRTEWDHCFPKYLASSKAEAIGLYWDDYYRRAAELEVKYPQAFRVFPTDAINAEEGQREILDFLDIPKQARHFAVGVRLNASKPRGLRRLLRPMLKLMPSGFPARKPFPPADALPRAHRRAG